MLSILLFLTPPKGSCCYISGKIFTTETTYKYRMQVQEEAAAQENSQKKPDVSPSSPTTPSPNKQDTPIKSILKPPKSDLATPNSKSAGAVKAELINQSSVSSKVNTETDSHEVKTVQLAQEATEMDSGWVDVQLLLLLISTSGFLVVPRIKSGILMGFCYSSQYTRCLSL